jgi:hypothetical protein
MEEEDFQNRQKREDVRKKEGRRREEQKLVSIWERRRR